MNKKLPLIIFALTLSCSVFAVEKITFNQAIDLAIKNNLEVQASYEAYKSSLYDKKSTRSVFFPKLSASLSYEKTNGQTLATGTSLTNDGYTGALNLSQNLFKGFSDYASLKIADGNIKTSEANLQETKAQISYDLKTATANYNYAKDSLVLSKDILKRREDNLRMVELRFENGRENKGSALLSKAYLEQAKLDLFRAQNAMEISLTYLRRILNLPEDAQIDMVDGPVVNDPNGASPDYNGIISNTPTAKRFSATLSNASATLETRQSGFYPSWDVTGSLGKTGQDFFPDDQKSWRVGTSLTWSFFDGGKDYYASSSANLLVKAAEKRQENQNLELKRVLTDNYASFNEAVQNVRVSTAFLDASKVRADISRSKYNNGLATFDDWDIIENDLITRQKNYTQTIRDRLIAEASWEQVQGTGVIP
ncbi:MAG: TolC family protein [Bacteriovorax sp.]|nr:TolC family protein [Bacteriovorax sp.]